ncbi:MAG: hypothetical protein KAQ68_07955 [Clostridiales bacterium]|nr:hypothetical protein [Clostridiales bacterium]
MKKLSTKEILLLVLLVFLVSGALYYTYYYRPYQDKMLELDVSIIKNTQRLITLQNQQQSIIEDTARLNNELLGIEDELLDIPVGVDEPRILVFIEESITDLANSTVIRFSPEVTRTEYFQINEVLISYKTNYENLKIILDKFENAPFRNRVLSMNASYSETSDTLGPQMLPGSDPVGDILAGDTPSEVPLQESEEDTYYLHVEMLVECFTLPGIVERNDYPFMDGPYQNDNLFVRTVDPAPTPAP